MSLRTAMVPTGSCKCCGLDAIHLSVPKQGRLGANGSPRLLTGPVAAFSARPLQGGAGGQDSLSVYTFGDSVLDCGHYNQYGLHPGRLLVRNDDSLFPEFKGRDLQSRHPTRLIHRATDGATVDGLARQAAGLSPTGPCIALLTIGGNDLIQGLASDTGAGVKRFEQALDAILRSLPIRPVLMGNVYDPTGGDDERNFLGVAARVSRANHRRVNDVIASLAERHGRLVDLHGHFMRGDASWFTRTIEPSLTGASEVRRAFLAVM